MARKSDGEVMADRVGDGSVTTVNKGQYMRVNFDYRAGVLEAGCPEMDTDWCWFRGDQEITRSVNGCLVGTLHVPVGATVNEVKATIRIDARGKR